MEFPETRVSLKYLANRSEYATIKPFSLAFTDSHLEEQVNKLQFEDHHNIKIRDIREREHDFDVNLDGFRIRHSPFELDINSGQHEELAYIRDMMSMVTGMSSADRVIAYDIRAGDSKLPLRSWDCNSVSPSCLCRGATMFPGRKRNH